MMIHSIKRLLVVLFVITLLLPACQEKEKAKTKNVKVVIALPVNFVTEQETRNGAELALTEAGGKAGNINVEIVFFETGSAEEPISTTLETQAAQAAADDSSVVAYLGAAASSQARVAIPILNEAGIATLATHATAPGLTKPGFGESEPGIYYPTGRRTFFRLSPSDEVQGAVAARFALQQDYRRIYLVDDGDVYGAGLTGIFEVTASELNLNIVGHESFDFETATAETYAEIANRVIEANPDMVYFGGLALQGGSALIGALRALDANLPIMGGDGIAGDTSIITDNGDLAHGIYASNVSLPPDQAGTEAASAFMTLYQQTYNQPATPNAFSGYEAMKVILYAIEHAENPNRAGVLQELQNLGDYSGARGFWSFDVNGDITLTTMSIVQIQDGEWQFVQVMQ